MADANVNVSNITIDVTAAQDAAGNAQADYAQQPEFSINTNNAAPVAGDDLVITNIVNGSGIVIPHAAMLANDTDANSDPLSVTNVGGATGGSAVNGGSSVTFTPTLQRPGVPISFHGCHCSDCGGRRAPGGTV